MKLALVVVALSGGLANAEPLKSKDGTLSVQLAEGWQEAREGSPVRKVPSKPDHSLFGSALGGSMQLLALEEAKEDIAVKTVDAYADLILGLEAKKATPVDRIQGKTTPVKLGGRDAVRVEIRGTTQNVNFLWVKFFTQTDKHWVQIQCWSMPSNKDKLAKDCAAMAASFAEVH